ncbi:aminotransferase class IV [Rhodoblastus acidophilus]|uniref:aminotransferase class IV n=1 Tax=Rhodoblastus acidophilus TaxID=1074 RepID=UPI0022242F5B|nr:aminotransferase class IV [Rhodoblastus acidophilus]
MSAESPLPVADDFGLIETMLWTRDGGYRLIRGHRARLENSARMLAFSLSSEAFDRALVEACRQPAGDRLRVRLELRRCGEIVWNAAPFALEPPRVWCVALAGTRLDSANPLLRYKTTQRAVYEDALAAAQAADPRVDEVIFLNERDEVCEGARTNLFLPRENQLLTPPLACGLLAGVLRADLLERGEAREQCLRLDDLRGGFALGNALRGLICGRLTL